MQTSGVATLQRSKKVADMLHAKQICVCCNDRRPFELESMVPGSGVAPDGKCTIWDHLLVRLVEAS